MYCCGENLLFLGPEHSVHSHLLLWKLLRKREKGEKGEKGGGWVREGDRDIPVEPASICHRYMYIHERES